MATPGTQRRWATPINSASMRKRSKLFIDGRLIIFPAAWLGGALFVPGTMSLYFIAIGVVMYALAKALFSHWPWFIDDFQAEMAYPYVLADTGWRDA